MMSQIKVNLSLKKVDAVDGCIGLQTLIDDKPYKRQGLSLYDYDSNGIDVIKVNNKPVVIINGPLDDRGVMQMPGYEYVE